MVSAAGSNSESTSSSRPCSSSPTPGPSSPCTPPRHSQPASATWTPSQRRRLRASASRHRLWQRTQWQQWWDDPAPSFGAFAAEPQCEPGDFVGDGDELFAASSLRAEFPAFAFEACCSDEALSEEEFPLLNLKGLCSEGFDNIRAGFRDLLGLCQELRQLASLESNRSTSSGPPPGPVMEASAKLEGRSPKEDVVVVFPAAKNLICSGMAVCRREAFQHPSCIALPFEFDARALAIRSAATVEEAHLAVVDHFRSNESDSATWYEDMLFCAIEDVRTGDWGRVLVFVMPRC
mmetsp:Transcript_57579/g.174094  ORF Transcript_57579/g.174094 Transcript_57579/m.174094 type:complete len:292 (+) Transcript_57579:136-1011(+)